MKKFIFLCLLLVASLSALAEISVCGVSPDGDGHFDCPYITRGTITWDEASHTLTLDNAVVEYNTYNVNDNIYPVRVTEDEATIVIHGECKLITNGYVSLAFDSNNSKKVTIQGDGCLYTSSTWKDLYFKKTQLTIKDIYLVTAYAIGYNYQGGGSSLTFDNVQALIRGSVKGLDLGINFLNCAITYPADAYVAEYDSYGYCIYCGNHDFPDHIFISRTVHLIGDVNNDSEVNILDVDKVIKEILGNCSDTSADVNTDGEINILDVDAIISIILGGDSTQEDHEYVDLGLPSGTLWATCNVGAGCPEDYGYFFAWGETEPKSVYDWSTYKWCIVDPVDGSYFLTKYCIFSDMGTVDNKTELEPEDDAAYVNWGPSWRMPTWKQLSELESECIWQWTTQYGVDGYLLKSKVNGNSMFLPATGFRDGALLRNSGYSGRFWVRSLSYGKVIYLSFSENGLCWTSSPFRYQGHCVRAVRVVQN